MATFGPWTAGKFVLGGTDLSDHVRSATLSYGAEAVDVTAHQDLTRINKGGLKTWALTLEMNQDFAASKVHATLFSLVGSSLSIALRASTLPAGATNPHFTGTGMLESYPPFGGEVGDNLTTEISIVSAGTLAASTST